MSIEMQTGTQVEVTCDSDAGLYVGMQGSGSYVLDKSLDISMPDTNTVTVGPGHILQNGFHVWLKGATDFTIPSGVQAQKRSIIVGFRSTKTRDEETMETIIRSDPLVLSGEPTMDGTPEDPEWIEGDLGAGDTIADFPICRVVTDGINALEPVPMYQVLASAAELQRRWDSLSQETVKSHFRDDDSPLSVIETVWTNSSYLYVETHSGHRFRCRMELTTAD